MRVAIAQLTTSAEKEANLSKARTYIAKAKSFGADVVILPEYFMGLATPRNGILPVDLAEPLDGPFVTALRQAAAENHIYVVCGVYESKIGDEKRAYNTSVFINRSGELLHAYRKTHLYDAFNHKESDTIISGENPYTIVETEFGKIGLMVCYELRFPEIARQFALQEAAILFVPAAWVYGTLKEDHWETLIRARAIENTMFVFGANQVGNMYTGRSLIVDPMGVIVASGGEEETLILADIDVNRIERVREKLPSVRDRKPEFYSN
ncbi:carbon-nitrogen hydrolase family protein [Neobacillus sp. OS1-32]|uniref:Carbon-nitrogen hydrolase family protein n=1 Tax=Neobacillus paridis TaxID=2803862 RepID=A0ABS1TV99_9BACI|nr:carbon-nitrogen hydrolase family protein [Neobacillus sp. OS1-32]MBL4954674.1 carbon-nitrogen hydrolase family protein [Neobacillus paridis]WML29911.1 carbon-nitrogen hydrolase family protein [Neobacillus sp. OS1-32]